MMSRCGPWEAKEPGVTPAGHRLGTYPTPGDGGGHSYCIQGSLVFSALQSLTSIPSVNPAIGKPLSENPRVYLSLHTNETAGTAGLALKATFCPLQPGASHQCEPVTSSFNLLAFLLTSRKGTRMPTSKGVTVRIKGGKDVKPWSGGTRVTADRCEHMRGQALSGADSWTHMSCSEKRKQVHIGRFHSTPGR